MLTHIFGVNLAMMLMGYFKEVLEYPVPLKDALNSTASQKPQAS